MTDRNPAAGVDIAFHVTRGLTRTFLLLQGETLAGQAWLDEKISPAAWRWGQAVIAEHRDLRDLLSAIEADGLTTNFTPQLDT
jgi:hypothetical protein